MPNPVSETVDRPFVSAFAAGTYSGDEVIDQSSPPGQSPQTFDLDLIKSASLASLPNGSNPAFTLNASESLTETFSIANGKVTAHFTLSFDVNVSITRPDGTVNPFDANISISGDLVGAQPKSGGSCGGSQGSSDGKGSYGGSGHDSAGGISKGGDDGHSGDHGGAPPSSLTLTDADTVFAFNNPGANGFDALIVAANQPTSSIGNTVVTDASLADQGAGAILLSAALLEHAFGSSSADPVQGIGGDDADLIRALAAAALAMTAQPSSQDVATAATLAATFVGGQLALDDALAAAGVISSASSPVLVGVAGHAIGG